MFVSIKLGENSLAKNKIAIVKCEICEKEREVRYFSNYKKTTHPCRSCSTTKQLKGKTYSFEHRKAISSSLRKKGWRMHTGYKEIIVDTEHPKKRPYKGGNYVFEHVLVMEKKLGRFLEEHELVHHIDENRLNNHPDNLYLCSGNSSRESRQIHNQIHQSAENLTIDLLRRGFVEFKDGNYLMTTTMAAKLL